MGSKHDVLTEQELQGFRMNTVVEDEVNRAIREIAEGDPTRLKVLDWGCGRGRSVAVLRALGVRAFGVDIDETVMQNGHELIRGRGLDPDHLLRAVRDSSSFPDAEFDLIFSEEVIEHVDDLEAMAREQARLTRTGGLGVHCFPSSMRILEGHVRMPLVHWLPKHPVRKPWISLMIRLGLRPPISAWPDIVGKDHKGQVEVYYDYLDTSTHYRDIDTVRTIFGKAGFEAWYDFPGLNSPKRRLLPWAMRRNGFPRSSARVFARKI